MDDLSPVLRRLTHLTAAPRGASPLESTAAAPIPWERLAPVAIDHGLGPIVSFNVDYRLGGGGVPEAVHDQLLGYYHGTLSDNVFKLVSLKQLLGRLDLPVVLLGAASYADAVYPHVAFRPLPEMRLLARKTDFFRIVDALGAAGVKVEGPRGEGGLILSDDRNRYLLYADRLGHGDDLTLEALHERGIAAKVYGPQVRRLSLEDALVTHVALLAEAGFQFPLIELVDLRELVLGCPNQHAMYDAPPQAVIVHERAEHSGLQRALYCAMKLLARFFPEADREAALLTPDLGTPARLLLDSLVIEPALNLERTRVLKGTEAARRALTGG